MTSTEQPPHRPVDELSPAAAAIVDAFEAALPEIARRTAEHIMAEVPAYRHVGDPAFVEEVQTNTRLTLEVMVRSLRGHAIGPEDLSFAGASMSRRVGRGLSVGDYLHAYRIALRVAWQRIAADLQDAVARQGAFDLVAPLIEYINASSTLIAAAFSEVEQLLLATEEGVRRELLDDLLAGRRPRAGARRSAMYAAGIGADRCHVVVSARPVASSTADEHAVYAAARALGRAGARLAAPLVVVRGDEVVAVLPVTRDATAALAVALRGTQAKLAVQDVRLEVGASTVVEGLDGLPGAYREAVESRTCAGPDAPVHCLFELTPFDYMTLSADETLGRLIRPRVMRFVSEDVADGGVLTTTLLEYAAADLNAKAASARMYVHVNTARQRLARIEDRTGLDLRKLDDVTELRIAIELARARAEPLVDG